MPLFLNLKERFFFLLLLLSIFLVSTFTLYQKFLKLKSDDVYFTEAKILKQYQKEKNGKYWVFKLKTKENIVFYTSSREDLKFIKNRDITIGLLTKDIEFLDLLTGFYARSIYMALYPKEESFKDEVREYIYTQHQDSILQEFFGAILLGESVGKDLREKITNLGVAHLIALSGFHLGVIFSLIAFLFLPLYSIFHKFFPYRNRLRDLFWFSFIFVVSYLYLVGFIPSLIRAFAMALFGYFLASRNFKILSFENLLWVTLTLVALFPKLLFSIGFFLSITGVFYIFLFVKFFEEKNKVFYSSALSIYLFVVMTPIVFFFFNQISYYQFLSPILTLIFTLFFPIEIFLHLIGQGGSLDLLLYLLLTIPVEFFYKDVGKFLFGIYILLSLVAIRDKKLFYLFCIFSLGCFTYLYV